MLTAFVPKAHSRSAVLITMMALAFIGLGMFSKVPFMSAFLIVFGVVMLCGAGLAVLNSRRMARMSASQRIGVQILLGLKV